MTKCGARSRVEVAEYSPPHICGLPKGHKERHRCLEEVDIINLQDVEPRPCRFTWGAHANKRQD